MQGYLLLSDITNWTFLVSREVSSITIGIYLDVEWDCKQENRKYREDLEER